MVNQQGYESPVEEGHMPVPVHDNDAKHTTLNHFQLTKELDCLKSKILAAFNQLSLRLQNYYRKLSKKGAVRNQFK